MHVNNRFFRSLRGRGGFTLVEILVATGIMSAIAVAFTSMMGNMNKEQRRVEIKGSVGNLGILLNQALGDPVLCKSLMYFGPANVYKLGAPPPAAGATLNIVTLNADRAGTAAAGTKIIGLGDRVTRGLLVQNIRFQIAPAAQNGLDITGGPAAYLYKGDILIDYQFEGAPLGSAIPQTIIRALLTVDTTAGGAITSCAAGAGAGVDEPTMCLNVLGGIYNPAKTPRCQVRNMSLSANFPLSDMALNGTDVLAVESGAGGRGANVFGATASLNLFDTEPNFLANAAASRGSLSLVGGVLTLSSPGNLNITSATNTISSPGATYTAAQFTTASDERLKENISPLGDQLKKITSISLYEYNFKADRHGKKHFGVMAQELQKIYPELVRNGDYLSVNYTEMVPLLIKSLQESQIRIDELERRLLKLEAQSRGPANAKNRD